MASVRIPKTMLFKSIMCELDRKKLVNLAKFIKIKIVLSNFIKPLR